MALNELDFWWSTLTVKEKERIATKIARIGNPDAPVQNYPHCTEVWQSAPDDVRQRVHDHCNDDHGLVIGEWSEGKPQSY